MIAPLLILGASTRAAAFSAIRAGFAPVCGDMFADADLRRFAQVLEVPRYPNGLTNAIGGLASMPWIYTGALENQPAQIAAVSRRHSLWGIQGASLKSCRDPWSLQQNLIQHGFPTLELREKSAPPPRDGTWLVKPMRSAAGRAITVWNTSTQAPSEPHYFQKYQQGIPASATFLGLPDRNGDNSAELLGVSYQLSGLQELHAPEFGYCGSIVPTRIEDLNKIAQAKSDTTVTNRPAPIPRIRDEFSRLGNCLAAACGLQGLFGIDAIWNGSTFWTLEVNPRYTASMELLEHSLNRPLLNWHQRACTLSHEPDSTETIRAEVQAAIHITEQREAYFGKVILYANRTAITPKLNHLIPEEIQLGLLPDVADIPVAGNIIEFSQPVFTCFGTHNGPTHLLTGLIRSSAALWQDFQ